MQIWSETSCDNSDQPDTYNTLSLGERRLANINARIEPTKWMFSIDKE
jgi:hypothetical protein